MTNSAVAGRRLERWLATSGPQEQQLAHVLATSLSATPDAIAELARDAYGFPDGSGQQEELLRRPFVERVETGFRIAEPFASTVRQYFREHEPNTHRWLSRALLERESARLEHPGLAEDQWFSRGRVAFYLAELDPAESALAFLDAFAHPPSGDPGPPRSWLADLVFRQREQLSEQERTVDFFEGWTSYRAGRFDKAEQAFGRVIGTKDADAARAISLHLWCVLRPSDNRVGSYLNESIRLSRELGLVENEVMATNTAVYRIVAASRRQEPGRSTILRAAEIAEYNMIRAEATEDRHLRAWCLSAFALTRWLAISAFGERADEVDPQTIASIQRAAQTAERQAVALGDLDAVVSAVNLRATILRDTGNYSQATRVLELAFADWRDAEPPASARRWAQTAGSMLNVSMTPNAQTRLRKLLTGLNRWLASADDS